MRLTETQLVEVMKMHGLSYGRLVLVDSGYRNSSHIVEGASGTIHNFIVHKNEPGILDLIKRVNLFSEQLSAQGLPVRVPFDGRIVAMKAGRVVRYGCLYNFLPGETIPWEAYTKRHIKLVGYGLARLHTAANESSADLPNVADEYRGLLGRVDKYFSDKNVASAMRDKLNLRLGFDFSRTLKFLNASKRLGGQQPLHLDFVRGNLLFSPAQEAAKNAIIIDNLALSGIIDLEKAARGHVMFDIARTLAFLMVDCPKPKNDVQRYFIDSGYRKRGRRELKPINLNGQDMLETLVTMYLVYDFYKFLHQNPYEALTDNHHFRRTRDILLGREVLQYSS